MNPSKFDIVFYGMTVPGYQRDKVKSDLAGLLKVSGSQIQTLFSGKRVVLKKNVNEQVANKYHFVLKDIGAVIKLEPHIAPVKTPPPTTSKDKFTLAVAGAYVLEGQEEKNAPPLKLDLTSLELAVLGADVADYAEEPPPLQVDHGGVEMSETGANVTDGPKPEPAPPQVNLQHMDLFAVGADVADDEKDPPPLKVDLGTVSMAVTGANVADKEQDPEPPKVDISAMSLDA